MSFSDLMPFALSSNQELAQRVSRENGTTAESQLGSSILLMEKFRLILKNHPWERCLYFTIY